MTQFTLALLTCLAVGVSACAPATPKAAHEDQGTKIAVLDEAIIPLPSSYDLLDSVDHQSSVVYLVGDRSKQDAQPLTSDQYIVTLFRADNAAPFHLSDATVGLSDAIGENTILKDRLGATKDTESIETIDAVQVLVFEYTTRSEQLFTQELYVRLPKGGVLSITGEFTTRLYNKDERRALFSEILNRLQLTKP